MRVFPLSVLLLAAACSSPSPDTATANVPVAAPAADTAAAPAVAPPARPVLRDVRTSHLFSDAQRPDAFRLVLYGDSALTATARFSIVSAAGDTLLSEQFPATSLIDYGISKYGDAPTPAQQAHYIRKRAAEFFGDEAFSVRTEVPRNAPPRQLNAAAWAEVKATGLPRFAYRLGEEDGRMIGYSPKRRRALVYYTCC